MSVTRLAQRVFGRCSLCRAGGGPEGTVAVLELASNRGGPVRLCKYCEEWVLLVSNQSTEGPTPLASYEFTPGLTVLDLKQVIAKWSTLRDNGEACEVWIGNGVGLSNLATQVWSLNKRVGADGKESADLLLDFGVRHGDH